MRVPADDLPFLTVILAVLEVNVITKNLKKPLWAVHTLYHGLYLVKWQGRDLIAVVHTTPCIEVFIGCTNGAKPRFHAIGNAGQRAIMQQMRNIAPIAEVNLFPCTINRRIAICRVFQFNNTQGNSVDKQKDVRSTILRLPVIGILNNELIDRTEYIFLRIFKINQIDHYRKA